MPKKLKEVLADAGVSMENEAGGHAPKSLTDREIKKAPHPRVEKLRDVFMQTLSSANNEFPYWYTREYFQHDNEIPVVRRAMALKAAFSHSTPVIFPGELLVMHKAPFFRGSFPMPWLSEGYYMAKEDELYQDALQARLDLGRRALQVRPGRRQRRQELRQGRLHRRQVRHAPGRDPRPARGRPDVGRQVGRRPGPQVRADGPGLRDQGSDHAEHRLHVRLRLHAPPGARGHQLLLPAPLRLRRHHRAGQGDEGQGRRPRRRRRPHRHEPPLQLRGGHPRDRGPPGLGPQLRQGSAPPRGDREGRRPEGRVQGDRRAPRVARAQLAPDLHRSHPDDRDASTWPS